LLLENVQELTDKFTEELNATATEVLGKPRKRKQPWITNEIFKLCDERRDLKAQKHESSEGAEKYRRANNTVRKEIYKAKDAWIEKQCCTVDQSIATNNTRKAFEVIKNLTKTQQTRPATAIEDKEGHLLTVSKAVVDRWKEYCSELYNYEYTQIQLSSTD